MSELMGHPVKDIKDQEKEKEKAKVSKRKQEKPCKANGYKPLFKKTRIGKGAVKSAKKATNERDDE